DVCSSDLEMPCLSGQSVAHSSPLGPMSHELPPPTWRIPGDCATLSGVKRVALLVAHGTISNLDDLPAFLQEIRRGRPAPPELLAELRHRYEAVGGSPHLAETEAQARALSTRLGIETRTAMRLFHPKVGEVVSDLGADDEVILAPLAPFSVSVYEQAARTELKARENPPRLRCIGPYGEAPDLIAAHIATIESAVHGLSHSSKGKRPFEREASRVILTAHSLPTFVIRAGDDYERQFRQSTRLIAEGLSC